MVINDSKAVLQNWEKLKAAERALNGEQKEKVGDQVIKGALDGVPAILPALAQAEQFLDRAGRVGFEWPDITGVWDKIMEEFQEIQSARSIDSRFEEIGDLLFSIANLARVYKVDPESALRRANTKFRERFTQLENLARSRIKKLSDLSIDEMLSLWQEVKNI